MRETILIGLVFLTLIGGVIGIRFYTEATSDTHAAAEEAGRFEREQVIRAATLKVRERLRREEEEFQQSLAEIRCDSGAYAGSTHSQPPPDPGDYPKDRFSELLEWNQQWLIEQNRRPIGERQKAWEEHANDARTKWLNAESARREAEYYRRNR
ncbi:MAG: hypothetical protein JW941_01405 [Candidatus Coatesbacteria bacterium]|nr:hypothetical protein [Candidatus Coatesbacteria bacterium]